MAMKLEEVGDDIYACVPDRAASGHSSSGLVDAGGGLVIDTQFDLAHAQSMRQLFGQVWRKPPRRVVNTHQHPGHTWGNQLFPNAEILAHHLLPECVRAERPEDMQRLRDAVDSPHPGVAARARALQEFDFHWIVPKGGSTFFDERLVLRLDGTEVHLIHVGSCHSQGDTLVHLPAEGVLFAGDVLCRGLTPLVTGSFDNWLSALDWILELDPEVIVPGHGPLCGIEAAMDEKAYLGYVWLESKRHFRAGRTVLEAAKRIELGTYAAWAEPERLYFNVEQAFRELAGIKAITDPSAALQGLWELTQSWSSHLRTWPVRGYRLHVAEDREHGIRHRFDPLELRGGGKRNPRPLLPLRQAVVGHAHGVAQHRNDRVHTRMVLARPGLRRKWRCERLLATCASQHLALVHRRLDRRLSLQLHILVRRMGVVELAPAQWLGAGAARLQLGMRNRYVLGTRVVLGPVAPVALVLPFPLCLRAFRATFRCRHASASTMATSQQMTHRLEQHRTRILGNLPFRQPLFQAQELGPLDLHRETPSSRRNSRTSGYTKHVFTASAFLLCRSIRPRPEVTPTSTQFAAR